MKVTGDRLRRLERGRRYGVNVVGSLNVLKRRLAKLEADYARIASAAERASEDGDPRARELVDDWLAAMLGPDCICNEIERIRTALQSPLERAREARRHAEAEARYADFTLEEIKLEVERLMVEVDPIRPRVPA